MKKLLSLAAVGLALCGLFVSCASTNKANAKASGALVSSVPHPRTYIIDMADSTEGKNVALAYNQWGPNYQSTPNMKFTSFIKADKPKAGDTIVLNYKFTCDKDLPVLLLGLVDCSPKANYWTNLLNPTVFVLAEDVKAGQVIEGSKELVLAYDVLADLQAYIQYDCTDSIKLGYPKVNDASVLSFVDIEGVDTTDCEKEALAAGVAPAAPKGPQTYNINVADIQKLLEMKQQADGNTVTQYQNWIDLTTWFDELPQVGDTINITYKVTSDRDIPEEIIAHMYESSASVNWWSEIAGSSYPVAGGPVVAGEPFTLTASFTIEIAPVESLGITFYYPAGDDIKASTWMYCKD